MAHSNYAKDRDLMQEAYSSVEGNIPHTQSTAPARLYNEGHCSDEEKITKVELGGQVFEIGSPDPKEGGIIVEIEKHSNGYMISVGEYNSPEDYVNDPDSATGGYGYALTLDGQPMDEDDLEDGLGHAEDNEHVPAEDSSCASNEEEHAAEDGEHAGYSVGDMIDGYDGEEIVTDVDVDGTIYTRELGPGGNKYTPEEINNLPS